MKRIAISLLAISIFFTSCESILDKQPLNTISDATVWSDPILMDDYLSQCYSEMRFFFEMPYAKDLNSLMDNNSTDAITIGDEATASWGSTSPQTSWIKIGGGHFEWWGYPTMRKLNIFIEKLQSQALDESYRKKRMAEARFLRAFAYFNLVKRYGGVALITTVPQLNSPEEELYPQRDKEEKVYDFILSELDDITRLNETTQTADLPEEITTADLGRPSRYAALALKSRVAMYAGSIATWGTVQLDGLVGIPQSKASIYWQASYDASYEILKNKKFDLYNKYPDDKALNFRNLFLDEGNCEVIFSERFDGLSGKGHTLDMINVPMSYQVWGGGQKVCPYLEMIESFDNIDGTSGVLDRDKIASGYFWTVEELWGKKDPRFKASIYGHGSEWTYKDGPLILDYHDAISVDGKDLTSGSYKGVLAKSRSAGRRTNFGMLKYLDEVERSVVHERKYSDTDYIVFRLGEIYLNFAEAAIELDKPGDALMAINKIRERAGMPLYDAVSREEVRKERKVELAFEGNRYFDVIRWRTAVNDITREYHNVRFVLDGSSYEEGKYDVLKAKYKLVITERAGGYPHPYFEDKHYYLPISLKRTGSNPNLIENPGYF